MQIRDIVTGVSLGVAVTAILVMSGCATKSDVVQGDLRNGMDIVNNTSRIENLEREVMKVIKRLDVIESVDETDDFIQEIELSDDLELEKVVIPPPTELKKIELPKHLEEIKK